MVLINKKDRKAIYQYLLTQGVITVKKDGMKPAHDDLPNIPNLHVMMVMKSMASLDLVEFKFNWQWFYYYLTDAGIEYLQNALHVPSSVQPLTLTKVTRPQRSGEGGDRERKGKGKGKGKKGGGKGGWSRGKGGGYGGGYGGGDSYGGDSYNNRGGDSYGDRNNWGGNWDNNRDWRNNNANDGEEAAPAPVEAPPAEE